jgi:hypothetical protein
LEQEIAPWVFAAFSWSPRMPFSKTRVRRAPIASTLAILAAMAGLALAS